MTFRLSLAAIGLVLAGLGGIGLIAYTNLLVFGYSYHEFLYFILTKAELYLCIGGLLLAFISLKQFSKKKKKHIKTEPVE